MAKLKMTRTGEFRLRTFGDTHCGVLDNLTIRYVMLCTCNAEPLDHRGFLFEQRNVQKFFERIKSTSLSCEQLARDSTKALLRMIRKENQECVVRRIQLTLSAEPFAASMSYDLKVKK